MCWKQTGVQCSPFIANFRRHGKSISANFTWTFLYRVKKGLCGKTVITSSIFRIEDYLKWGEKIQFMLFQVN